MALSLHMDSHCRAILLPSAWKCAHTCLCVAILGCNTGLSPQKPSIDFTKVPPESTGGPDRLDTIEGHVSGSHRNLRIVLYAKAGDWWVQPFFSHPFTEIADDGGWRSATHLGTDYGALLVEPDYHPALETKSLPKPNGPVVAVAVSQGAPVTSIGSVLKFSGYDWSVRHGTDDRYGAKNYYSPSNVWIDVEGYLHLRIVREPTRTVCADLSLTRSLGYGTYVFKVRDITNLEPAAALSFRTWDDQDSIENHREMDLELSKWGNPSGRNADYAVQPYFFPENKIFYTASPGTLVLSLHWEEGKASFQTVREGVSDSRHSAAIRKTFTVGIPEAGNELLNINFCDFKSSKEPLKKGGEIVIENFQFLP